MRQANDECPSGFNVLFLAHALVMLTDVCERIAIEDAALMNGILGDVRSCGT